MGESNKLTKILFFFLLRKKKKLGNKMSLEALKISDIFLGLYKVRCMPMVVHVLRKNLRRS